MKKIFYAGIGSRETPLHIQDTMSEIASILERKKIILRSGGAEGADLAFEKGVINSKNKEIYRPDYFFIDGLKKYYDKEDLEFADKMVKEYHPSKGKMKNIHAYKLQARNTFQIFGCGRDTVNSSFVICYTPDGAEQITNSETGGTGQAIRLAYGFDVPVYNLKNYIGVKAKEMVEFIMKDIDNNKNYS